MVHHDPDEVLDRTALAPRIQQLAVLNDRGIFAIPDFQFGATIGFPLESWGRMTGEA
jgi:hypothetical protein